MSAKYTLVYWPFLPGRGEFPRLILEDLGVSYRDIARLDPEEGGGVGAVRAHLYGQADDGQAPWGFAPPYLVDGELAIAQMPAICAYLGEKHDLVDKDAASRAKALQLCLSIADVVDEAHDVHHPLGTAMYYEEQKDAALIRAKGFRERLPKWLGYFESTLAHGSGFLLPSYSYVDLCLFQLQEGLWHAFPRRMASLDGAHPRLAKHRRQMRERENIAAYLKSDRRRPFNRDGIFRDYPELDGD